MTWNIDAGAEISRMPRAVAMHMSTDIEKRRLGGQRPSDDGGCIATNDPEFEPYFNFEEQVIEDAVKIIF